MRGSQTKELITELVKVWKTALRVDANLVEQHKPLSEPSPCFSVYIGSRWDDCVVPVQHGSHLTRDHMHRSSG